MSTDFLKKIVDHKRSLLDKKKVFFAALKKNVAKDKHSRYSLFKKAIAEPGKVNLIAEIKKASPSQGIIRRDFDVTKLADIYVKNGAAAISVLTEDKFFLGKPTYLKKISEEVRVPLLMKDFIIHEMQIYEAFVCGASAVLLIVAILTDTELKHLLKVATDLDLCSLIEVHDEEELKRALNAGAEIIGINNRDLRTFTVDLGVSERVIPKIPEGKVIVIESGIKTNSEVKLFKELGAHAVLIGETFLRAADVGQKMKEVMHGQG